MSHKTKQHKNKKQEMTKIPQIQKKTSKNSLLVDFIDFHINKLSKDDILMK